MLGSFFPIVYIFFASQAISQLEIGTTGLQFNNFGTDITGYNLLHPLLGSLIAILVHNLLIV